MDRLAQAQFVADQAKQRAKASLRHYFEKALPFPVDGDVAVEIDGIVDDIIEASVAAAKVQRIEDAT